MKRAVANLLLFGNISMLFVWGIYRPLDRYEEAAAGIFRRAVHKYRSGSAVEAYLLYRHLADEYDYSDYAEKGEYYAARTAYRELGQFETASAGFQKVLADNPSDTKYVESARQYLAWLQAGESLPEEIQWEFAQAVVESDHGQQERAASRFRRIIALHPNTDLAKFAQQLLDSPRDQERSPPIVTG